MFQFQTGSIKRTVVVFLTVTACNRFQFQTGSIKSLAGWGQRHADSRFQFQTGSIKRQLLSLTWKHLTRFNSKLVRLKAPGK